MKSINRQAVARRDADAERPLLERILDVPHLARVVPRLQPEVLHRVIQRCGLEDCGELLTLATPGQLTRVFDLDLWRVGQPGVEECFDADRFGLWIEVLVESGVEGAAQTLAGLDVDLVVAGLAQHLRVFDPATLSLSVDGEAVAVVREDEGIDCEVGGYLIVARRADSWDAIVRVLATLDAEHPAFFHRVMRGCRALSNSTPEVDGLDDLLTDPEQAMFDLAIDRERRREKQGYVTPEQARAFLQASRELQLGDGTTPPGSPVAQAYFRAIEWTDGEESNSGSLRLPEASAAPSTPDDSAESVAAIVDVLLDAGVLPKPPRALLDGPQGGASRLARMQTHLQRTRESDPAAYAMRSQELAYLANTIVAGCSIQSRPFTAQEASDAAVAVCNLGLENWPRPWLSTNGLPDDFLVGHDLVTVFQVGWAVLHKDVGAFAAERLIDILARVQCDDAEIQAGLDALRVDITKGWRAGAPWRAQESLDVIMILDAPAWAALVGLLGECPVMHAAIAASAGSGTRTVSPSAFEFISEHSQILAVRDFMASLPKRLGR